MNLAPIAWALLAATTSPAQEPAADPMAYLRLHRAADLALQEGDPDAARAAFRSCLELSPENATVAYGLAATESRAGHATAALEWLERAAEWGYRDAAVAAWDEDLAPLRGSQRFEGALATMREGAEPATEIAPEIAPIRHVEPPSWGASPSTCAIDPDGRTLLVGYDDGSLALVDARTGVRVRHVHSFATCVWATAFAPDGSAFAALAHDGRLGMWEVANEEPLALASAMNTPPVELERMRELFGEDVYPTDTEPGPYEWAFGAWLRFDPTGERLLVAGREHGGSLWTRSGECARRWEEPLGTFFGVPIGWSPDGETIAWASDSVVRFFNGRDGRRIEPGLECGGKVKCVDFRPDGGALATGHADGFVREWSLADRRMIWEAQREVPSIQLTPEDGWIGSIAYSPDGRRLACTTGTAVHGVVFDVDSHRQTWVSGHSGGRMGELAPVRWSPDGRRLWYAFASGGMELHTVGPAPGAIAEAFVDGFVPSFSEPGPDGSALGVTILGYGSLAVLDSTEGRVHWMRVEADDGSALLQAPTGHFTTELDSLTGWTLAAGYREEPVDLAPLVGRLFDPKRVRASCAGIRLHPSP